MKLSEWDATIRAAGVSEYFRRYFILFVGIFYTICRYFYYDLFLLPLRAK